MLALGEQIVDEAFQTAERASNLTDRALWLLFLIVILVGAWWMNRNKEKELTRLRKIVESALPILSDANESLKNLETISRDLKHVIDERDRESSSASQSRSRPSASS
jgi:hypothetical protein